MGVMRVAMPGGFVVGGQFELLTVEGVVFSLMACYPTLTLGTRA